MENVRADWEQGLFRMHGGGSSVAGRIAKTKESVDLTSLGAIFHGGANETVIRLNSIRVAAAER